MAWMNNGCDRLNVLGSGSAWPGGLSPGLVPWWSWQRAVVIPVVLRP